MGSTTISILSQLLCIFIMFGVSYAWGLPGMVGLVVFLALIHIWYRRRYGRWME